MNNIREEPELNAPRWGTILGVLSLDLAAPYVTPAGLELPPGTAFVEGLRGLIVDFRSRQRTDTGVERFFAGTVMDWSSGEFGAGFADYLRSWGEHVFQYSGSDGAGVFLWENVLRSGGLDGSRDTQAAPDFVRSFRLRLATAGALPEGFTPPQTAWDREFYDRHGYDQYFDPMDMMKNTVSRVRFRRAWEAEVKVVGARLDLSVVERWGRNVAARLGMPLERLGKPGEWPPLPSAASPSPR